MNQEIVKIFNLHPYQEQLVDFCIKTHKCGLFLQMGLGKTRIALAAITELVITGELQGHCLIIAPKAIARSSWIDEINNIGINVRYSSFLTNEKGKELTAQNRLIEFEKAKTALPTMYFISRDLLSQLVDYYGKDWCFPMVIVDEYQSFKSPDSKRSKSLNKIMPYTTRMIGLTGTPTPNGLDDLWNLVKLLDNGERLGKTMKQFHKQFFLAWKSFGDKVTDWIPQIGAETEIYKRISDICVSLDNTNLKLPPVVYQNIYAYLSDSEMRAYKKMIEDQKLYLEDALIRAVNPAVLVAKLGQIASGIVYTNTDHDYIKLHERKIEQLQYIYDNEPTPLLVAYHYKTDIIAITEHFKDAVVFDGKPETVHEWNEGKIRMLLIQPASAGFGLNLQKGGNILIWYTLTWSLEEYLQTNARIYRQGQTKPCSILHIVAKDTIEERILQRLNEKDTTQKGLIDAVRFELK